MWEYITSTHRRQNRGRWGGGTFFAKVCINISKILFFSSCFCFPVQLSDKSDRDVYTSLLLTPLQHLQESSYTDPVLNFFQERGRFPRDNVVFISGGGGVKAN